MRKMLSKPVKIREKLVSYMNVSKIMMADGWQGEGVIVTHAVIYITRGTFQYHYHR